MRGEEERGEKGEGRDRKGKAREGRGGAGERRERLKGRMGEGNRE